MSVPLLHFNQSTDSVNYWIAQQTNDTWHIIRPGGLWLTGEEYKQLVYSAPFSEVEYPDISI
jgi:hypothetical protein